MYDHVFRGGTSYPTLRRRLKEDGASMSEGGEGALSSAGSSGSVACDTGVLKPFAAASKAESCKCAGLESATPTRAAGGDVVVQPSPRYGDIQTGEDAGRQAGRQIDDGESP